MDGFTRFPEGNALSGEGRVEQSMGRTAPGRPQETSLTNSRPEKPDDVAIQAFRISGCSEGAQ
jgi:hypothetical protein